jgi:hypothetical protein
MKLSVCDTFKKTYVTPFSKVNNNPHKGPVSKVERNPGRNLLLSLGQNDRTINVYMMGRITPKLINSITFAEQPLSFSLHPLSMHLAVSFRDCLSIFLLLHNDYVPLYKESTAPLTLL